MSSSSSSVSTTTTTTTTSTNSNKNDIHIESNGVFTMTEYKTLCVICDTLFSDDSEVALNEIESLLPKNSKSPDENNKEHQLNILKEYFKRKSSDLDVAGQFLKLIAATKSSSQISDLKTLLGLLSTTGAGIILTGQFSSFVNLPLKSRQQVLTMMKSSSNPIRRQAFKAIVPLVISIYYSVIISGETSNPNWDAVGYDTPSPPEQIPGEEKLSFIKITSETSLKADAVVIGSGAGGGVTAAILAEAGYKVIVLEKGSYISSNNMSWKESEAFPLLYEQAGTLTSDDLSINILAGSCLGGGTTVNWTASIRTPDIILEEWRKQCPNAFESSRFNRAMDSVSSRLNVNTIDTVLDGTGAHNKNNKILEQALRDLDADPQPIPRNTKNCDTSQCGNCSMGCRSKSKQSSMVTYLEDCCSKGGQIITNCQAEEITTTSSPSSGGGQTVHGVIGYVSTPDGLKYRIFIKAHIVVCSAGALHTPTLLLKSRIKNSNIGNNLYLHPVIPIIGEHTQPVDLWKGPPMTVISKKYQKIIPNNNLRGGKNTGSILETPNAHIGLSGSNCSFIWEDSFNFKKKFLNARNFSAFISICRDTVPGKIRLDKDGKSPKIQYKLSDRDWKSMMPSVEASLRALIKNGAVEASIPMNGFKPANQDTIEQYIKSIKSNGYKSNQTVILSAHQMGSCRMGSSRSNSVVNENGESWDVKRLFISDGSVLPTSVGVNPMITIYAISHIIANQIIQLYPLPNSSSTTTTIAATTSSNINILNDEINHSPTQIAYERDN
ncbi:hypothetical protein RB653_005286 [Dictyostelium firmibasis]|uniref:Long-chain-alcohol oxidase n=1 Tax=Dictyostelium firmibasis TaxID=79012 RepID=A0AAN7U772_9MYCE